MPLSGGIRDRVSLFLLMWAGSVSKPRRIEDRRGGQAHSRPLPIGVRRGCQLRGFGNHPGIRLVGPTVRPSLQIAAVAAIAAALAGCGSGSGGHSSLAIRAVVRAGCSAGPITAGRPYPGRIVLTGAGGRKVVRIRGREVTRVAVDPGDYRVGAAWVASSRIVSARVDGRPVTISPQGRVRFTLATGAETELRLVVGVRRPECTSPGAAG